MFQKIRKYLALIGPYPYNPYLIFLLFLAIMVSRFMPIAYEVPAGPERHAATALLAVLSLIPTIFFAGMAWLYSKFRFWSDKSLVLYIAEVALAGSFIFFYFPLIKPLLHDKYGYEFRTPATASLTMFISSVIMFLLALALIHRAERSILKRLETAKELVEQLKLNREELIGADEQVREQTSRFLHDRVQSDLMVVGMKLRSIAGKSTDEVNEVIEASITRLEGTRTHDLRNLVQILAPNFEAGGIKQALSILALQYQDSMQVFTEIDDKSESLSSKELLGAFRIVEQSLINALMHGPATQVLISLKTNESGTSELTVSDNGPGMDLSDVTAGTGTAIIDSWVGILEGKKTVDTVPGHGYRLVVNFPA
jgi:signal transduction histidine kinase